MTLDTPQSHYTPDAGTHEHDEDVLCGCCDSVMDVKFNCFGARGSVVNMHIRSLEREGKQVEAYKLKSSYDAYSCPFRETDWHEQATNLFTEAKKTSSAKLAEALVIEAMDVIAMKHCTKKLGTFKDV